MNNILFIYYYDTYMALSLSLSLSLSHSDFLFPLAHYFCRLIVMAASDCFRESVPTW